MTRDRRSPPRFAVLLGTLSLACSEPQPTELHLPEVRTGPGGGNGADGVEVTSIDPSNLPQGITQDVTVGGSGFEEGFEIRFLLNGKKTNAVRTNSTTFVNEATLQANVTVDPTADLDFYDVEAFRGKRRGIGIDLLRVTCGGGGNDFSVTIELREADLGSGNDRITGDGSEQYANCVDGNLRIRDDGTLLWNVAAHRAFHLDFDAAISNSGGCADDGNAGDCPFPNPGETRVGAVWVLEPGFQSNTDLLDGQLLAMNDTDDYTAVLRTRVESDDSATHQLRFQYPGCCGDEPIDGAISGGSSFLRISRAFDPQSGVNTWTIEALFTDDGPGEIDDWAMVFSRSGRGKKKVFTDEGSFHMPFRMTVTCKDCPAP